MKAPVQNRPPAERERETDVAEEMKAEEMEGEDYDVALLALSLQGDIGGEMAGVNLSQLTPNERRAVIEWLKKRMELAAAHLPGGSGEGDHEK